MSDALEELELLVPQLPSAVERQRLGQELDDSAGKLRLGLQEAERLRALLVLASLLGLNRPEQRIELDEMRKEARVVGEALLAAEDAEHLKQATDLYEREFLPALKRLHRDLISHWETVSGRDFRPLIQVGAMLELLDHGSTLGRDLATCARAATNYKPGHSATEFLDHIRGLLARRDKLQEQRRSDYGDGAISIFVNALAENRAKLDMVTPEVRNWLDMHGASQSLRVVT